jgi:hypothetical protein
MIELDIPPEQHFRDQDYSGSELIIFKYDADQKRLLFCFDDLSEKIPQWVAGKKKTSYFFRYKVIRFHELPDLKRSAVDGAKFSDANDFYIMRDELAVPIEDIEVKRVPEGFGVKIYFERGFGIAAFNCKAISIHQLSIYFKNRREGKNYYYADRQTKKDFDEKRFLEDLYSERDFVK